MTTDETGKGPQESEGRKEPEEAESESRRRFLGLAGAAGTASVIGFEITPPAHAHEVEAVDPRWDVFCMINGRGNGVFNRPVSYRVRKSSVHGIDNQQKNSVIAHARSFIESWFIRNSGFTDHWHGNIETAHHAGEGDREVEIRCVLFFHGKVLPDENATDKKDWIRTQLESVFRRLICPDQNRDPSTQGVEFRAGDTAQVKDCIFVEGPDYTESFVSRPFDLKWGHEPVDTC